MTRRGWDLLALLCREGETIAGAARRLGIHPSTAKNTLTVTYRRMGVRSIAEACYCLGVRDGREGYKPAIPAARPDDV